MYLLSFRDEKRDETRVEKILICQVRWCLQFTVTGSISDTNLVWHKAKSEGKNILLEDSKLIFMTKV